jgi:hypothetical protein
MKKSILLLSFITLLTACSDNSETKEEKAGKRGYDIDESLKPSGEKMSGAEKEARLELLISESKRTMDSIDMAYKNIRRDSRAGALTLDEREQVNEVLIDLSDARDLIILEMQESVIANLKEKTAAMQTVMVDMNAKSERMMNIAATLSRVSGVIGKLTNTLADALSFGLVRPSIEKQSL